MKTPTLPGIIADAISHFPEQIQMRLLAIRELIFLTALETDDVGQLTETLKWKEPAYLTEKSKSGTTIRLGVSKTFPDDCALFFNCKTTLIDGFRNHFSDVFSFEGNRALIIPVSGTLPYEPLMLCIRAALTYHHK